MISHCMLAPIFWLGGQKNNLVYTPDKSVQIAKSLYKAKWFKQHQTRLSGIAYCTSVHCDYLTALQYYLTKLLLSG